MRLPKKHRDRFADKVKCYWDFFGIYISYFEGYGTYAKKIYGHYYPSFCIGWSPNAKLVNELFVSSIKWITKS